jgi:hypothetical protein
MTNRFSEYAESHPEFPVLTLLSDLYALWVVEVTAAPSFISSSIFYLSL